MAVLFLKSLFVFFLLSLVANCGRPQSYEASLGFAIASYYSSKDSVSEPNFSDSNDYLNNLLAKGFMEYTPWFADSKSLYYSKNGSQNSQKFGRFFPGGNTWISIAGKCDRNRFPTLISAGHLGVLKWNPGEKVVQVFAAMRPEGYTEETLADADGLIRPSWCPAGFTRASLPPEVRLCFPVPP